MKTAAVQNLNFLDRTYRLSLSLGVILFIVASQGYLGLWSLVPLLAIYPGITAMIGWDPVYAAKGWNSKLVEQRRRTQTYRARPAAGMAAAH